MFMFASVGVQIIADRETVGSERLVKWGWDLEKLDVGPGRIFPEGLSVRDVDAEMFSRMISFRTRARVGCLCACDLVHIQMHTR